MGLTAMCTQECQEPSDTLQVTHTYVGACRKNHTVGTMPAASSFYCFRYRLTLEGPGQSQKPSEDTLKGGCTLGSALE